MSFKEITEIKEIGLSGSVITLIKERKSVRSYIDKPLTQELINKINACIVKLSASFGSKARVVLVSKEMNDQPVKLGTYGVISGAVHFLVLIVQEGSMTEVSAGYMFENLILYCTELGLGTCWLGGTLKREDFLQHIELKEGEKLAIISPVGFKREKKTLLESIMRAGAGSNSRKPFSSLFYKDTFDTSLNEDDAGSYKIPLEMVRLAPSASNKQPWRIVKENNSFHFYHKPGRFSLNDIGIALCHFELTCQEFNLRGNFEIINEIPSSKNGAEYVISWIAE